MKHLVALFLFLASPSLAADYPARVVGVTDGDTLTVLRDGKTQVKIRLHGIDAPETGQPYGSRAKQAASELAFGKDVTVREVNRDRYGRTVAEVMLTGGRSLGLEMVAIGMAWHYVAYSHDPLLTAAEADARRTRLGLWADSNPVPPWDWRKVKGVPITAEVVGNRRSHVYHLPHCRGAAGMRPESRVSFKSAADAEEKGYRKAGDCR